MLNEIVLPHIESWNLTFSSKPVSPAKNNWPPPFPDDAKLSRDALSVFIGYNTSHSFWACKLELKNKKVINDELLSLIINQVESSSCSGKEFYKTKNLSFKKVLDILYKKGISSLLVEGGAKTLNNIIEENSWDEARVFTGNNKFDEGIKAPSFELPKHFKDIDKDKLYTIYNNGRN